MLNVLFVAAEGTPFIKTGGLADVIGSLPKALVGKDTNISVIMPKYKNIAPRYRDKMKNIYVGEVMVGWRHQYCGIDYLKLNGVHFYFVDNEFYFHRENCYGEYDDGERFGFFCRAVLEALPHLPTGIPDILHCHDWHAGAVSALYKLQYRYKEGYENIKLIYTIHNLKYQGVFPMIVGTDILNLDEEAFNPGGMEFYGNINFMKAGILFSDWITTVSETYSKEIRQAYYGEGLDGLLRLRGNALSGITNGIDYDLWNPENDAAISTDYTYRSPKRKRKMKEELQADLGLDVNGDIPMISMITRIVDQKGFDLLGRVLNEMANLPLQLVVLGVGEEQYEGMLRYFEMQYPKKISLELFFDDNLARRIYAASDIFLMPSRFEPCGIGQLIAMRYGTIPIARSTGGLVDTIENVDEKEGLGTGFLFNNYNAHEMLFAIERAVKLYAENPKIWNRLIRNAMQQDFSWNKSAQTYITLYEKLTNKQGKG